MLKVLITFILLCSIGHSSTIRDLYEDYNGDMAMMISQWDLEGFSRGKTTLCGSTLFLGGPGAIDRIGSVSRTYTELPGHNVIYFDIGVILIGGWNDPYNLNSFTINVDGSPLKTFAIQTVGNADKSGRCSGNNDLETRLVGHFYHSSNSVTISLAWKLLGSYLASFAIKDVSLTPRFTSGSSPSKALLTLTDTLVKVVFPKSSDNGKTNCPSGSYNDGLYCMSCNSACQDCFGPSSSQCYQCKWGYGFDGEKCVQCSANCAFCSGGTNNQCSVCNPGYTLDFDGTCNAEGTCNTESSVVKKNTVRYYEGFVSICAHKCPANSLMLWNYTCVASCDAPLVVGDYDPIGCESPCLPYQYLMNDGRCLGICPSGYVPRMETVYGFCDLKVPDPDECHLFKYQNGSCLAECPSPYIHNWHETSHFCVLPCSQGEYFHSLRRECVETCEPEYTRVDDNILYCDDQNFTINYTNGCESPFDFKYPNGSCLLTCPFPHREFWNVNSYFCHPPCPGGYYHGERYACTSYCEPRYIRIEDGINYCDDMLNPNNGTNQTNTTSGCPSIYDFKYPNGSCLSSCPYPRTDEWHDGGYFCNPPCPLGYFDLLKDTCVDSCEPEYIRFEDDILYCDGKSDENNGTNSTNSTVGCPNIYDFKYPNGSCLPSCPSPRRDEWLNGSYFCYPPCSGKYYDSEIEACINSCEPEYIRFDDNILYCDGKSDENNGTNSTKGCLNIYSEFEYPNGSCLSSCPYPRRAEWQWNNGGGYLCLLPCPAGYAVLLEGDCVHDCKAEFIRFYDDILYCDDPHYGNNGGNNSTAGCPNIYDFKYPNGSCLSSCPYPRIDEWRDGSYFCNLPCPGSYYDSETENCVNSCEPGYARFDDGILYCDSKNSTTGCQNLYSEFEYPNGSCLSSCPYPRRAEWQWNNGGGYLCLLPCPAGYAVLLEGDCVHDCKAEYIRFYDDILYCDDPHYGNNSGTNGSNSTTGCPNIYDFKYPNGSCLPSCPFPHRDEWLNGSYFCNSPCPGRYYDSKRDTCVDSCEPEDIQFYDGILYCNGRNSTTGCLNIYSEFEYPNGSCLSSCPFPRRAEWQWRNGGGYLCLLPCPAGYAVLLEGDCVHDCKAEYIRFYDDILYCDDPHYGNNGGNNGTNSTTGCPNIYDFKYPNGSCLPSCPYPRIDEWRDGSYFCNLPCPLGYFDVLIDACIDSCEPEYVRFNDDILYCDGHSDPNNGTNSTNSTTGCPSIYDFKYPNGSCLSSCPYPRRDEWHNGSYFCYPPCPSGYFDTEKGICVNSCQPEYVRFEDNILYCDGHTDPNNGTNSTNSTKGCLNIYSEFEYPNGSCLSSCPYPRRAEWQWNNGGGYLCLLPCPAGYAVLLEGDCVHDCKAEYIRFYDDILYCDDPHYGNNGGNNGTNSTAGCPNIYDFKYPNGSCLPSCPYPRIDEWRDGSYFCNLPCPGRYYDSEAENCVNSCEPGYARFDDGILYCDSKNSTTGCQNLYSEFEYPNGSCLSSCPYPRRAEWQWNNGGGYLCLLPCPAGYTVLLEGDCVHDCKAEYIRFYDDILYCDDPHYGNNGGNNGTNSTAECPNIYDFKYPNGSCLPSCPYPRIDEWRDGSYFCNFPCPLGYFDVLIDACVNNCEPEYIRFDDDILYCDGHSDPNNGTNSTNSTTGCPSIYDFKYPNGSCLSSCPYPRRDEWHDGGYFCNPPCPLGYFDSLNQVCVRHCEPEYIRFEDDILYCDGKSDSNNGTNNTNSTAGCPSIFDFKYPNGSCLSSCPYPYRDEWHDGSYFCYPPCPGRYFDIMKENCVNSCEPEYIRFQDDILYCYDQNNGTNNTNSTSGCPNIFDFKYPNGSCLSSCPYPRRDEWHDGAYFCYSPCPLGYFDTLDQICVRTCEAEYIRFEDDILYCDGHSDNNNGTNSTNSTTGCPSIFDFKYPNGSCLPSCPYPRRDEWHNGSYFCYPPCPGRYYDSLRDVCVNSCEPEYIRFDDDIIYCDGQNNNGTNNTNSTAGCPDSYDFKYPNGSCLPSCPYPYRDEWHDGSYFCYPPCPGRYYDTLRDVCVNSCDPEYIQFEENILYCTGHSNGTNSTNSTTGCPSIYDFKYPNGSCLSSCPYPRRDEWHDGAYFCYPPCPLGYFDTEKDSCINSCEPEFVRFDDDILYCDGHSDNNNGTNSTNSTTGCPNIFDFKYPNGSCLPNCSYPRRDEWQNGTYFCYPPCPLGYFDTEKDSCVNSCQPEFVRFDDDILYCDGHNNGTNNTNSTTGCPSIYDFKYPNGSCLSSCPYPRRDEWHDGSYFCYPPCPLGYFDVLKDACVNSCEPEYVRFNDDILYCDGHSDPNNGTNSTNSTTGCPNIFDYKYPNGSCLPNCSYPRRAEWNNGSYFCYPPCPLGYFDTEKDSCVNSCQPEFVRFEDDILYCDGSNNGTNSTNTTGCPNIYDFKYPNGSCLSSCPYPRRDEWHDGAYFCYPPCPLGYFDTEKDSCINSCQPEYVRFEDDILYCDGHTDPNNGTNSTNSTTGCPSIYEFKYPNGSCLPNCPYPYRDEWHNGSYFCYPPCPDGYWSPLGETCIGSCELEFIQFVDDILYCIGQSGSNNGTNSTNSTNGCPSIYDFKYPNGSCLPSCPYPYRDEWHDGSYFCYPPCPGRYYDTLRDVCVNSCEPEYIQFEEDILYCTGHSNGTNSTNSTTGCPSNYDFKYPNGSCLSSCPYPRRDEWHNGSYFCYPPCPLGYFDTEKDSCINSCEPEYVRFEDDILYCDGHSDNNNGTNSTNSTTGCPNIFDFKYPNGSCLSSCPYPRRDEWHDGSYFCYPPCPNRYFNILNDKCVDSCEPEFVQFEEDILYCTGQSNSTNPNNGTNSTNSTTGCPNVFDFKYPNGSCLPSCPYPRRDEWHNGSYFCYSPCPLGYFDTLNQVCVRTCEAEYIRFEDDILYCDGKSDSNNGTNSTNSTTGCPSVWDFKYPNGSCLSSCPYPHRDEWHNGSYFCYPPCPGRYYDSERETCVNSCEPEYIRFDDDIIYCDGKSDENNGTNSTNSTRGCLNIYSEFEYPNGSCLSSCSFPRRAEWQSNNGGGYLCLLPCPAGYAVLLEGDCVHDCKAEYLRFYDDILYCDDPHYGNNTNSTAGCPNIYDFKYPNGSCLSSCPYPRIDEWRDGSYFCDLPCPNQYFDILKETCLHSCEPEYIRFDDDILYCDGRSDENNGTNSTNSTIGCPSVHEFKYPNGSCLSKCPFPRIIESYDWRETGYFCSPPCSAGSYFHTLEQKCVDTCQPEFIRERDNLLYCDDPLFGDRCPGNFGFKYPNNTCRPSCDYPYRAEYLVGLSICHPPCQNRYFDSVNMVCLDTCEPQNVRNVYDIHYCDPESTSNNGTNSTNSTTGCPNIYDFKYENGSCLSTCPYPYQEELTDGSYFCNTPCPNGYFDTSSESCVDDCQPESIRFEDDIAICEPSNNSSLCSIDYATDGSATTDCTDPSGYCPTGSFLFEDYSCNVTCPAEFTPSLNASCTFPCGLDGALYPDGSCSSDCSTGYTVEMIGNFQLCVKDTTGTNPPNQTNSTNGSVTVTIEIYIRYNITLTDFNQLKYLIKFINLLANLLGVDPSEIIIISVTEGSTIIEAKVELTSASDSKSIAAAKAKAETMNDKLDAAILSKGLNLDGIAVLNSKFSVITPENNEENIGDVKKSSASSSSSSKIVVLIVIIAIAAVAVLITACAIYRYKLRRKSLQVVNLKRAKEYSVEGNQAEVQEKKKDEEMGILDDNSRIHDIQDQDAVRQRARALAQEKIKQMRKKATRKVDNEEVEQGKPVSLNEIMRGIDE